MPPEQEDRQPVNHRRRNLILIAAAALVAVAATVLLAFFTSAAGRETISRKITLVSYFTNASGLKSGAPVDLDGVGVGTVKKVMIAPGPEHRQAPVEVIMRVSEKYRARIRTDSKASLLTEGAVGDTELDILSEHATGPPVEDGAVLPAINLVDSLKAAQEIAERASLTVARLDKLSDEVQQGPGSIGRLMSDKGLMNEVEGTSEAVHRIAAKLSNRDNSAGRFMTDRSVANKVTDVGGNIDAVATRYKIESGPVNANIDEAQRRMKAVSASIGDGKGSIGMLKSPEFQKRMTATVNHADDVLAHINSRYGPESRTGDDFNNLKSESNALFAKIKSNPMKYLSIDVRLF